MTNIITNIITIIIIHCRQETRSLRRTKQLVVLLASAKIVLASAKDWNKIHNQQNEKF